MKKGIIFLLFIFISLPPLQAQEGVDIFGYFETQASGAQIQDEFLFLYSNKLRVDL